MPRKSFIFDVPCTTTDRYRIYAESEKEAKEKMVSLKMSHLDYEWLWHLPDENETHWDQAVLVTDEGEEVANA